MDNSNSMPPVTHLLIAHFPQPYEVTACVQAFALSSTSLRSFADAFLAELARGLRSDGETLKCLPSFVSALPPAGMRGKALALDVGGTNARVCLVTLENGETTTDQENFRIPEETKGDAAGLFGFLAACVARFVRAKGLRGDERLGFTFSFPVKQTALAAGTLLQWTKGFETRGVVGQDVVVLLSRALADEGLPDLHVAALVNDTVGTLLSHAIKDPRTSVGMIVGTGSNACYLEQRELIEKMGPVREGEGELMVVNLESGGFGSGQEGVLPLNRYDREMIAESTAPGEQWFEKMIAGMYLGELARRCVIDLHSRGLLLKDHPLSQTLSKPSGLHTAVLSRAAVLSATDLPAHLSSALGVPISPADAEVLYAVFSAVSRRAALLCGAVCGALVEHMGRICTVAVDGSVAECYPGFREGMAEGMDAVLGTGHGVRIEMGKDGSGVGAAVAAALA